MPSRIWERFIADTLYKKLWKHDDKPCPYGRGFYVVLIGLNRMTGWPLLKMFGEHFFKEVFFYVRP